MNWKIRGPFKGTELTRYFNPVKNRIIDRALVRIIELYGSEFTFKTAYGEDGLGFGFSFDQGSWIFTNTYGLFEVLYWEFHCPINQKRYTPSMTDEEAQEWLLQVD